MKVFATGALALTLGLGGCMHGAMHEAHHEHMGMMGQHQAQQCPNAPSSEHEQAPADAAAHDPSAHAAQPDCPRAAADQHQHDQPPN